MYLDLPTRVEGGVYLRGAAIFVLLCIFGFTPPVTACTSWASERSLVRREESQKMYTLSAFYVAKTSILFPVETMFALVVRPPTAVHQLLHVAAHHLLHYSAVHVPDIWVHVLESPPCSSMASHILVAFQCLPPSWTWLAMLGVQPLSLPSSFTWRC